MKLGNQDVSGMLRDYIDGTVPFILSSHLFILWATCCKGQDIYSQGITGVCDAVDLAVLPAGCVQPRALGMRAASSTCVQSRPVLEIMKLMMRNEFTDFCQALCTGLQCQDRSQVLESSLTFAVQLMQLKVLVYVISLK